MNKRSLCLTSRPIPLLVYNIVFSILFSFLPLLCFGTSSLDNETQINLLKTKIELATSDSVKVQALLDLNHFVYQNDVEQSKELMVRLVDICQKNIKSADVNSNEGTTKYFKKSIAMALRHLGSIYNNQGNHQKAINYFKKSLEVFKELEFHQVVTHTLTTIAWLQYLEDDSFQYMNYLKEELDIGEEMEDSLKIANVCDKLGYFYRDRGNYSKAIEIISKSLSIYESLSMDSLALWTRSELGTIHLLKGDYAKAIRLFTQVLQRREQISDQKGIAYTLTEIGYVYARLEDFSKAKEYFEHSLVMREQYCAPVHIGGGYYNMGYIHTELGDYAKAKEFHNKALDIRKDLGYKEHLAESLNAIGDIFKKQDQFSKALNYYNQSIKIYKKLRDDLRLANSLNRLGEVHRMQKKYRKAIELSQEALGLAEESEELIEIQNSYHTLYLSYKQIGQKLLAFEMFEKYTLFRDSLQRKEDQRAVIRQEYAYQYEKQSLADSLKNSEAKKVAEAQFAAQKAENILERQKNAFIVIILLMLLLLSGFTFYKRRNELQQKLNLEHKEALRLKELDQFKSKLYTNLTHEFRTPLTVILGMAERARTEPQKFIQEGSKIIERNGKNLLRIVNQLLDLSKMENQAFHLQFQQSDVIAYLRYITESFHSYAKVKNLSIDFYSTEENLVMDYDSEQMKQVMTNLISNAIKFTPPGGVIKIRVFKEAEDLQIKVEDNGIGIPKNGLPQIFERFYQVDDSTTRGYEGTGIGLAHTKELINLMRGQIKVESVHENEADGAKTGSTFTIRIPISNKAPLQDFRPTTNLDDPTSAAIDLPPQDSTPSNDALPSLLIIEDNPDVVFYLKSCLEQSYQLEVAYNGSIGVEMALDQVPDLIISDVMMPGKDGFEVCDILKNDERTSHIPFILLTAKADLSSKLAGLERGADAYLSKPFQKDELLIRLQKLLEGRQKMSAYFAKQYLESEAVQPAASSEKKSLQLQIEDTFIQKVNAILDDNIHNENFGLMELRTKIGIARSPFFRKMKALTNIAPSDYIRAYRLKKAKYLLEHTENNVAESAYAVGFSSPSYFTKVFQKAYGVTPGTLKR